MSKYDKDLKVGDIIYAYHSGIHQITKIERRFWDYNNHYKDLKENDDRAEEYSSLIHYEKLYTKEFKRTKKRSANTCDAQFCCLAIEHLTKGIVRFQNQLEIMKSLEKELKNVSR